MIIDEDLVVPEENNSETMVEEEVVEESNTSEEAEPETIQEDEEDRIVTIGDSPSEDDSEEESTDDEIPEKYREQMRKLRKTSRGLEKKNKALQKQLEAKNQPAEEKPVELGEEPTLKSCNYDDAKFRDELRAYDARKKKVEEREAEQARIVEEQNKEWAERQKRYVEKRKEHGFKDFAEAEELVSTTFSQTQQGIMVEAAEDAALVAYALGKNPKKLEELAKITNPVRFTYALAKLEAQLKVTNRKAPKPEKRIGTSTSSGSISGNSDSVLERLREEADRTGDRTKVVAYMRQQKSRK